MPEEDEVEKKEGGSGDESDDDPPPGEGLSEEIYEVERILGHTIDLDQVLFYQVRWKNFGPKDDSWEPADNLGSAGTAIQEYWDKNKKKDTKKKATPKKTPTPKQGKAPFSGSSSRSRAKKATPPPEPEEPESDAEKSGSDDEEYDGGKKKKAKVVSKGALKAYEPAKRAAKKDKTPPISKAKKVAMENRKGWLFDNDNSSDDSDDEQKKELVKEKKDALEPSGKLKEEEEVVEQKEEMEKEPAPKEATPKGKPDRKKKASLEPETTAKSEERRSKRGKEDPAKEQSDGEEGEPTAKRGKLRPPTPPKPSRYSAPSETKTSPPPQNIEYFEPENGEKGKVVRMKIKLPRNPTSKSCFKTREKTTADILFYNGWQKFKPLSEIKELKEIDIVEGIMISEKGSWNVFARDVVGTCCILTAEEAYDRCGWTLVQYLLSRAKFT